jgi:hypothetical protein
VVGTLGVVDEYIRDALRTVIVLAGIGWLHRDIRRIEARLDRIIARPDGVKRDDDSQIVRTPGAADRRFPTSA